MSPTHTVLVTGGTANLGFHCALNIARQHPEYLVVISSRTDPNSAADSIKKNLGQQNVVYLPLDLSSLEKVRSFATSWEGKNFPPIIALVLNAGLQFPGDVQKTVDGIESTFAINHVGHALLFHLLFPHLAENARVVVTASGTHDPAMKTGVPDAKYTTAEELAHPTPESEKNKGRQRYATSKLVNVMWSYSLHKHVESLPGKRLAVLAFDPGLMPGTGLARDAGGFERCLWNNVMPYMIPLLRVVIDPNTHKPEESGASLARLAIGTDLAGESGVYYVGREKVKSSDASYDVKNQEDLWNWTVKNIAKNEEEVRKFETLN